MVLPCILVPCSPAKQLMAKGSQAGNLFELAKALRKLIEAHTAVSIHGGCSASKRDVPHRFGLQGFSTRCTG